MRQAAEKMMFAIEFLETGTKYLGEEQARLQYFDEDLFSMMDKGLAAKILRCLRILGLYNDNVDEEKILLHNAGAGGQ